MILRAENKDCMEIMKEYPDKYFDLAVIDPPYGINVISNRQFGDARRKDGSVRLSKDKRNGRKSIIMNEYKIKDWDSNYPDQQYFNELFRVSQKQIIFGENYIQFEQKTTSTGRIFWDKVNGSNDFSDGEMVWTNLFSSVRQIEYMWNGMLQGKSFIEGRINQGNKALCEKRIHVTQKPIELYKWIYKNYAKPEFKIIDTHLGSGSNLIAADNFKISEFVCCEIDKEYFTDAMNRYKEYKRQLKMF